jgi:hypothetical protein
MLRVDRHFRCGLSAANQAFLDMIGYGRKDGSRVPVLLGSTTFGDQ